MLRAAYETGQSLAGEGACASQFGRLAPFFTRACMHAFLCHHCRACIKTESSFQFYEWSKRWESLFREFATFHNGLWRV